MKIGHVYIVNTVLAKPKKDKITLCICTDDNLFLWINSEKRYHNIGQFELKKEDHGALTHDCYMDCSRLTTFPPAELTASLERGCITNDLAQRIIQFLSDPDTAPSTLVQAQIDRIINNLSTLC